MPYNGTNGTYSLPAGNPVVSGTTISSSVMNNTMTDIAAALSSVLVRDGEAAMTGTLNMGGQAISNAAGFTASGTINVGSVNVTSATVPANGEYLPAANTWGVTTNSTQRFTINATGNLVVAAPTAGVALTVNGFAGQNTANFAGAQTSIVSNTSASGYSVYNSVTVNTYGTLTMMINGTASTDASGIPAFQAGIGTANQLTLVLATNGTPRLSIAGAGGTVTVNAPSSGNSLVISGVNGGTALSISSGNTTNVTSDIYVTRPGSTANAFAQGPSIQLNDTANGGQTILQQSGGQTELWQYNGAWNQIFSVGTSRGFNIKAAANTSQSLSVTGGTNAYAVFVSGAGQLAPLFLQTAGVDAFSINGGAATGSATATFSATNKPGSNAGVVSWLKVTIDGTLRYIPIFG